jgi:S-adenosyl-L-methionine hydrolase (adenosine-forming)
LRPLTLLTDFGNRDVYVGVMKGVIAQINPNLTVIDLTHLLPPQDIAAGRFCLMDAYPYFPNGTVHVAVVDPGVGSQRRCIAVEFANGFLVGPDNGLFSGVLSQSPAIAAVELTNVDYWRNQQPSSTFHGRDIFASVGAHLASGIPLKNLGKEIDPATFIKLNLPKSTLVENGVVGCVQYIDHFGNLVSNIPENYIPKNYIQDKNWHVKVDGLTVEACTTYSDVQVGDVVALVGSHGWVEIAVNNGNAQSKLNINLQDAVKVEWKR